MAPSAIGFLLATALLAGDAVDATLSQWEHAREGVSYEQIAGWARDVRAEAIRGDREVFGRVWAIAQNSNQPARSRTVALGVACDFADEEAAQMIVDRLHEYLRAVLPLRGDEATWTDEERVTASNARLITGFIVSDLDILVEKMGDDSAILGFLKDYYVAGVRVGMKDPCIRLISRCEAAQASKRETALAIISAYDQGLVPDAIVELLDAEALPGLRKLVLSQTDPREFHYAAADALSQLGDLEIRPHLETLLTWWDSAFGRSRVQRFIWRIDVQNPPTKLLGYIAGTDWPGYRDNRAWAVRRAYRQGLPAASIRDAILEHAAKGSTREVKVLLPSLKAAGLEFGILQSDDLPDVRMRVRERDRG